MLDPTTLVTRSMLAGTPTKLICVRADASRLPGRGDTVTDPASRAELFTLTGAHVATAREAHAGALRAYPHAASASAASAGVAARIHTTAPAYPGAQRRSPVAQRGTVADVPRAEPARSSACTAT